MRKRWGVIAAIAAVVLVIAGASAAAWLVRSAEPRLRAELEAWLSERFNSDVTLASLDVDLFPTLRIAGTGLVLRIKDRPDLPPFITIHRWEGRGPFDGFRVRQLDELHLDGVDLQVPPRRSRDLKTLRLRGTKPPAAEPAPAPTTRGVRIDRLVIDAVRITVLPRYADKDAVLWDVQQFVAEPFALDAASPFTATVDTPLPNDRASVLGTVGPWPRRDFDLLPITAHYTFEGDLGAVPGMDGTIQASGDVLGTLERLATTGVASANALRLTSGDGGAMPMTSTYEAVFDGTSGDLFLTRLTTTIGESAFETSGTVLRIRGVRGRHITMRVKTPDAADVSDVLELIVDGERPPMRGRLVLDASLDLPPGPEDVLDRLTAAGSFRLQRARFTSPTVQGKVDELARRGQGRPTDTTIAAVPAEMQGEVDIGRRRMRLRAIRFAVPGASVEAAGTYGLDSERLDFRGIARLDARASRTQRGAKRFLLLPIDPFLRKEGAGTRLVLDIKGTKAEPKLDLDLGASLRGRR
jgi:hypothetical protein